MQRGNWPGSVRLTRTVTQTSSFDEIGQEQARHQTNILAAR